MSIIFYYTMDADIINIGNKTYKPIIINNIDTYNIQFINNNLHIIPKSIYLSEIDFLQHNFKNSEIIECVLNNENIIKPGYYKIVRKIWKLTPVNLLLQNTIFNFKLNIESIREDSNYIWNDELKLAYQTKNFNYVIKEIIKMCNINNISIILKIKLNNDIYINYAKNYE